jgi:hypothetical protein
MRSAPIHHAILKLERPPFVSILTIVRDAVARLPDGVGTRLDVLELCKESQYLATNTIDENLMSMTVGGGLDRLQAEEDPCTRFEPAHQPQNRRPKTELQLHGEPKARPCGRNPASLAKLHAQHLIVLPEPRHLQA